MIQAKLISKSYQTPGETLQVLNQLSLNLTTGESAAIIGPSGCGKTTLLNLLGALDRPSAGSIIINGQDISTFSEQQATSFRNQSLGFIFQQHHLLPQLTALENVLVPRLSGTWTESESTSRQRAINLLEKVEMNKRIDHLPWQLSGGEKLRCAVARALINQPSLILADEPTGSLDPASTNTIADLLLNLNIDHKATLLVVTHNPQLARRMSHTYELRDGALLDATHPASDSASPH